MQPGGRRPSSSATSASSSAAAAKKTAKSSREVKAATYLGSAAPNASSQNHATPPAPHPSSFSGGRSLLPPAPPRSQPHTQSSRALAAATLPVCSVEIGAFHIGDMTTARMACYTPRITRSQAASTSTVSCSGSVKRLVVHVPVWCLGNFLRYCRRCTLPQPFRALNPKPLHIRRPK
jgi:hypothetical protein